MQGGGLAENAIVPLNLAGGVPRGGARPSADFVVTGGWSQKSLAEAGKYCTTRIAASNVDDGHTRHPGPGQLAIDADAAYVHICSNETIHGVEFQQLPDLTALGSDAPLVVDFSSHVASRPVDWSRVGLAFAGAQKNLGPAGLTVVVVRDDLLGHALADLPERIQLQAGQRQPVDVQHAADLCHLHRRPGVPVAQAPGRHRRHGAAQHRQGAVAV